jgi:membrane protein insertase Oxa1/YidC/SpoIIIJ
MVLLFTIRIASALSLYWLVGGLIAYAQQSLILREDEEELEAIADSKATKDVASIPEAEVVKTESKKTPQPKAKKQPHNKRRKR